MSYPEINDKSTIPELIGLLRSTFLQKEFNLAERMLIRREEELKSQIKVERSLLEKMHGESELERLKMSEEIERLKKENLEIREELKKLKREKQEAEENAQFYVKKYEKKVRHLEQTMASILASERDVADIGATSANKSLGLNDLHKEGDSKLDCQKSVGNASIQCENIQTSYGSQSPSNDPLFTINASQQEKGSCNRGTLEMRKDFSSNGNAEIGTKDVYGAPKAEINGSGENKDDSLHAATTTSINRIGDEEFPDKEQLVLEKSTQVIPSTGRIRDRPRSTIIVEIGDSDDEVPLDKEPVVTETYTSEVNSSKKGVTFLESRRSQCPTQTEDENRKTSMSNTIRICPSNRKRSLIPNDDSDSYVVFKQKMSTFCELLNDVRDSIVNTRSLKLDSAATSSQPILPPALVQMVKKRYQDKAQEDCNLQTASRKPDFDSTDSSDSSDDSCADSEDINDMVKKLREDCRKSQNT